MAAGGCLAGDSGRRRRRSVPIRAPGAGWLLADGRPKTPALTPLCGTVGEKKLSEEKGGQEREGKGRGGPDLGWDRWEAPGRRGETQI